MVVEADITGAIRREAGEAGETLVTGSDTTSRADWLTGSFSSARASDSCASVASRGASIGGVGYVRGVGCVGSAAVLGDGPLE